MLTVPPVEDNKAKRLSDLEKRISPKAPQFQSASSAAPISPTPSASRKAAANIVSHALHKDFPGWLLAPGKGCQGSGGQGSATISASSRGRSVGKGMVRSKAFATLASGN